MPPPPYTAASTGPPFSQADAEKLGIVGGGRVGKSFLFQAMVYRALGGANAGALNAYVDDVDVFMARHRSDPAEQLVRDTFIKEYCNWQRLAGTEVGAERWYRLRMRYRTGLLGRSRSSMDVEFFDGSGEGFFAQLGGGASSQTWLEGFQDARMMVFCLPLWAAFPRGVGGARPLTDEDWKEHDHLLEGFGAVLRNFRRMRDESQRQHRVKTVLALTMADDPRGALTRLHDNWIAPYLEAPDTYLRQLRSGAGIARYLANARRVSEALWAEFDSSRDNRVSSLPRSLNFGHRPWLIPLSAVEGEELARIEREYPNRSQRPPLLPPVPVHVELPLLVALCERTNALM